jgi:hypothetical protein
MISPTASSIDGAAGIWTAIPSSDLVGVALHEFTHAMGREPGAGTFDLSRYTSPGVHLFSSGSTAPAAYFSIDGGVTKLADYGQNSDPSDFLNGGVQGPNDPFNEFYSGSTVQSLSTVDKQLLDALGFDTTTVIGGTGYTSGSTGATAGGTGGHKSHKTVAAADVTDPGNSGFVFAPASGHFAAAANSSPASDPFQIGHEVFAKVNALLAASNSGDGHAVIPNLVHDAPAMLHAHDFHVV